MVVSATTAQNLADLSEARDRAFKADRMIANSVRDTVLAADLRKFAARIFEENGDVATARQQWDKMVNEGRSALRVYAADLHQHVDERGIMPYTLKFDQEILTYAQCAAKCAEQIIEAKEALARLAPVPQAPPQPRSD